VTWEPDFWGRVRLAVQNAAAAAQVSAADVENMRLSIQGDLAADYVDRHGAGVASRTDVVQADNPPKP